MSDFPCCEVRVDTTALPALPPGAHSVRLVSIDLGHEAADLRLKLAGLGIPARPVGKRFDIAETLLRAGYPADYVAKVAKLPAAAVATVQRAIAA